MSRHRAEVRPRYGRIAVLGSSVAVTAVAILGSIGVLPNGDAGRSDATPPASDAIGQVTAQQRSAAPTTETPAPSSASPAPKPDQKQDTALPAESGDGRRAVFSQSRQRVWLVDDDGSVERTYLVSGSVLDNLDPGDYSVYSRSRWATGIEDSGVMQYFVRFAKGPSGAAIGFHSIPTKNGDPLQTLGQLGTPQSHGCIRQKTKDAVAMWDFADLGTDVVVTA